MNIKFLLCPALFLLLCFSPAGQAEPEIVGLKTLLQESLNTDPQVREAMANVQAAQSSTGAAEAGHYPVVSLTGTQPLAQQHTYQSNAMESGFHPGAKATLNLYAWGGIEAGIAREKAREDYYQNRYSLTREELSQRIGQLYLLVLRYNDMLAVTERNLARHQHIADKLTTIVAADPGRLSELTQVRARLLKVEMAKAETGQNLQLALSRLATLTGRDLQPSQFTDPFSNTRAAEILARFQHISPEDNPGYQAELANARSLKADADVAAAAVKPAVNLEMNATPDNSEMFVRVSWNIFDMAGYHNQAQKESAYHAAGEKAKMLLREIRDTNRSAAITMTRTEQQSEIAQRYISEQTRVISNNEKQFTIGRRTLIDLLDAYNELAGIEAGAVMTRNDFRDAALTYLSTQARLAAW